MAVKFVDVKYKQIFNDLNLVIKANQITSIVGKSGSGKTSILNLIFGFYLDFIGEIIIDEDSITNKTNSKKIEEIRKNIFYLSEDYRSQLFNINILEDIKYGVSELDNNKLCELLKTFNLSDEILSRNYLELSDGEAKKVLIVKMLVGNNKTILLDEPTKSLDQKSIGSLVKILKKEKRNGKTIIITSKDSEFLLAISDKVIVLDNGKLIEKENKYDFFTNQRLLNKAALAMPDVLQFRESVLKRKNIKLVYRDNINDLIKDIYRYAK